MSQHPLASLIGPLRYACQRDFAYLSTVKDLRTVLERALAGASGVDARALAHLRSALPFVDHALPEKRKAALRRVVGALRLSGVALPPELEPVAAVPTEEQGAALAPKSASAPVAEQGVPRWKADEPVVTPAGYVDPGNKLAGRSAAPPGRPASPVRESSAGDSTRANALAGRPAAPARKPSPAYTAPANGESAGQTAATVRNPVGRPAAPAREPSAGGSARANASGGQSAQSAAPARLPFDGPVAQSPAPAAKPAGAKPARKKKKAAGADESRAEAKLLSIAPRAGPLSMPLKTLGKRLGPRLAGALDKKGLRRLGDVLFLLPRCYEDRRRLKTIAELMPGERGVTVGVVKVAGDVPGRTGRRMFRAVVADASGSIAATYFTAGPWLKSRFPVGKRIVLSGEIRASLNGREIAHPEIESAEDLESSSVHFNRIVPVYPGFERGDQRSFRELAARVAENYAQHIEEPLPPVLRERLELTTLSEALRAIHFPPEDSDLEELDAHMSPAHRRLAFDELFFLQLGMGLKRQDVKQEEGIAFNVSSARLEKAKGALPFQLTRAQTKVVAQLAADMGRPEPMSRLVQGDVGSGKTAVAIVASLLALQDGYQVAVLAPTEILAEQHERTFRKVLEPLGFRVGLVTASGTAKQKRQVREAVGRGEIQLAVGTHALLEEGVSFDKLGLAVIDEQHRFGVLQRHALMSKGVRPDVLVMTATPIPRTLAMTMYGDLDYSVIDELPPGRTPITTRVFNDKQRARVYEAVAAELVKGHQAYIVYPLVEESEKLDLEDATRGAEKLRGVFPDARVGLLHGRMKADEKDAVMEEFRERRLQVLVCTTVVEVGVDVPNASVMVIEAAERFGLSQLHQLRGRVGRGAAQSHCFLVAGPARSLESSERLAVMERSTDGFVIAQKDLDIRGPGEFLGTRQSGLPELAVANLARDGDLISVAQEEARNILERDPRLEAPEHQGLVKALEERWEGRLALAKVG
ncbi:ATP-dependent DNA helicase RecG [Myxococcaceae bacterium GXIMD 01537]